MGNQGRNYHACGSYVNRGKKFLMVTGGWTGSTRLDSTEIFSDSVWRTVAGKLPDPMSHMSVATINTRVLSFGGYKDGLGTLDTIMEFNPETESWTKIGTMKRPRYSHGVSVV